METLTPYKNKIGTLELNVNGFIFEQKEEIEEGLFHWVCELQRNVDYKCTAQLITHLNDDEGHEILSQHMLNHNHEPYAFKRTDSEPEDQEEDGMADDDDASVVTIHDNYTSTDFSNMVEVPESMNNAPHTSSKRFIDEDKSKRHCTEVDDEYDAIGVNVAAKLRNLPGNMRILAEKLINDVLYQAQTNGLTNATFISTPDPFK